MEAIEEEKRIRWADFWPEVRSGEVIAGLVPESERARAKDRGALVDPVRPSAGGVARRAFDQIVRGIASPEAMDVVSIRYLKPSWAEEVLGERGAITGVVAESVKAGAGGRGITIEEMRLEDLGSVLAIEKSSFSNPWTMAQFKAELAAPHGASVPPRGAECRWKAGRVLVRPDRGRGGGDSRSGRRGRPEAVGDRHEAVGRISGQSPVSRSLPGPP